MGIKDWLDKKRTDKILQEESRELARQEALKVNEQREIDRRKQLVAEAYQKEMYKQTTPKSQQFQEGLQKVGGKLQGFTQKAGEIGKEFNKNVPIKSGEKVETYKKGNKQVKVVSRGSSFFEQKPKFGNSINLDNTINSKMGNKVFGNTFNQSQDSLKKKIGGFSKKL